MNPNVGCLVAGVLGAVVGFVLGAVGYVAAYYLIFMLPQGEPPDFRYLDQAAIPVIFFGPLGSLAGALAAGLMTRAKLLRKQAAAPPAAE